MKSQERKNKKKVIRTDRYRKEKEKNPCISEIQKYLGVC